MNVFTAYADGMRRYANFDGRSSRSQYWFFLLVMYGAGILLFFLPLPDGIQAAVLIVFFVIHILPSWAISVRRLHDFDVSGWWLLLGLFLGTLFSIGIGCVESTEGANHYGPSPHDNPLEKLARTFE